MKFALKLLVTLFLISVLLYSVDINEVLGLLGTFSRSEVLIAFLILFLQLLVTAHRWKIIMDLVGIKNSLKKCVEMYWTGLFFNQLLPSSFGGDFARIILSSKNRTKLKSSAASIIFERFLGLAVLLILALMSVTYYRGWQKQELIVFVLLLLFSIFMGLLLHFTMKMDFKNKFYLKIKSLLVEIYYVSSAVRSNKLAAATLLAETLVSHISIFILLWLILFGVGSILDPFLVAGIAAVAMLASALPISIAGWGVRETILVVMLAEQGVSYEKAVASGIALGLITLIFSLPGIFFIHNVKSRSNK